MSANSSFKKEVIQEAIDRLRQQVKAIQQEQKQTLTDANSEDIDKGDVAESPKEQMMDEFLGKGVPLEHLNKAIENLQHIVWSKGGHEVSLGSLVQTNAGYFLIGATFPEFTLKGTKIVGLSTEAPLFKKMQGLKPKAEFHLHDREYIIQDIL